MKKILWIGNSFTYYNDLPKIFEEVARAEGKSIFCDSVTKGGWYLHAHADPQDEIGSIVAQKLENDWDAVILQEQSYHPVRDHKDYADAAASIISRCKNARIYLYQTWSYAPDSPKLISTGLRFETMHRALRDSITAAGAELQVGIAPVGDALYRAVTEYPELQMYISDHYHPAPNLSYLAALVFYKTIYGEGATRHIPETVSAQDAKILQHIGAMK